MSLADHKGRLWALREIAARAELNRFHRRLVRVTAYVVTAEIIVLLLLVWWLS